MVLRLLGTPSHVHIINDGGEGKIGYALGREVPSFLCNLHFHIDQYLIQNIGHYQGLMEDHVIDIGRRSNLLRYEVQPPLSLHGEMGTLDDGTGNPTPIFGGNTNVEGHPLDINGWVREGPVQHGEVGI
ncbi:hypothetical protein HAX54_042302 [Datura stramonium]|uniref:Uncharacterized protein n=1 Tax=Datura stramonium TaxID=4076 RepID=A0ABS8SM32_DATST|nr:hypothetical protein [Datura stramonium]